MSSDTSVASLLNIVFIPGCASATTAAFGPAAGVLGGTSGLDLFGAYGVSWPFRTLPEIGVFWCAGTGVPFALAITSRGKRAGPGVRTMMFGAGVGTDANGGRAGVRAGAGVGLAETVSMFVVCVDDR